MDLVLKQWWTNAQGTTGVDGGYQTRSFLGDYKITVTHGGQSKTVQTPLPKEGQTLTIALT